MDRQCLRDVTGSCTIRIDKDGRWYYQGSEMINKLVLEAFCNALEADENGRYRIVINQEVCYIDVEDTPFVVASLRGDPETGLSILLNTGELQPLDPDSLCIGKDNILYCFLKNGMKVRFSRAAYYLFAFMLEEDEQGNIILKLKDKIYPVLPEHLHRNGKGSTGT